MATVWDHLSVEELEERFVGCEDATASRHFQVIWLLARGHTISQVSGTTAYGERWIEQLLARYNAEGPEALGDLRRRNGWEALKAIGWSIQKPRPKNPKSATPEEAAAFKKSSRMPSPLRGDRGEVEFASHPSRNLAARPQPAIGRRVVKAQAQFSEQVGLQDRWPDCAQPATNGGGTSGNLRKSL